MDQVFSFKAHHGPAKRKKKKQRRRERENTKQAKAIAMQSSSRFLLNPAKDLQGAHFDRNT
jgi:hypothetical protein